jgi:hypothetical protein
MVPWQELITDGCRNLFEWGPGLLLAVIILYGIYKILLHFGREVGMKIIGALEKPAEALNKQAQSMDKLTNSIQDYVGRDANEHQEIIILQKVIRQEIKETRKQTDEYMMKMKEQSDRIENYFKESPDGRS